METSRPTRDNIWHRPLPIGVIVLGLVAFCGLGIYVFIHRFDPPPVWSNPPLYSGAQHVAVQDWGSMGKYSSGGIRLMKMITFTVADKEENVIAFYKKAFSNSNMKPGNWGREVGKPKALNYSWSNQAEPPFVYFVDLITTPASDNEVQVEIGMSMFPGY